MGAAGSAGNFPARNFSVASLIQIPMHHQLISTAILSTMLVLAPHTQAANADEMRDLTAKARKGDAAAQLALAVRYRDGKGVTKDNAEAMRWAHLAADKGDAAALDFVGWMFFRVLPEISGDF